MAADKYIKNNTSGALEEVVASVTSTANAIVAMDATGHLDISVMPIGVGAETVVCVSSENLAAGAFVNLYLSGGVITARNADNTTVSKPAYGYVISPVTSPANATVYLLGTNNTGLTSLTIGTVYFLGTVGGVISSPSGLTTGNLQQELGIATTSSQLTTYTKSTIKIA